MKTSIKPYVNLVIAAILLPCCPMSKATTPMKPEDLRLPDDIKVYYSHQTGLTTPKTTGAKEDVLPTNNEYKASPGCYIACYSNNSSIAPKLGAYPVEGKTYVMGQIRVKGHYYNGMCIPTGYEHKALTSSQEMKETCEKSFPAMCEKGTCWANGNTSHWFY